MKRTMKMIGLFFGCLALLVGAAGAGNDLPPELVNNGNFRICWSNIDPDYWAFISKPVGAGIGVVSNGMARLERQNETRELFLQTVVTPDPSRQYRLSFRCQKVGKAPATVTASWGSKADEKESWSIDNSALTTITQTFTISEIAKQITLRFAPPAETGAVLEVTEVSLKPMRVASQEEFKALNIAAGTGKVAAHDILLSTQCAAGDKTAAWDLRREIFALTGTILPVVAVPEKQTERNQSGGIYIGRAAMEAGVVADADMAGVGTSGYLLRVKDGRLAIVGQNQVGVVAGVYSLLEKLGVKYYQPDLVTRPERGLVTIPEMELRKTPAFEFCIGGFDKFRHQNPRVMGFTDINAILGDPGEFSKQASWVHAADSLVSYEKYCESHPEYFAHDKQGKIKSFPLRDGKVVHWALVHLCMSNPDVQRIATESLMELIRRQPDRKYYFLTSGDGLYWCDCPSCQALDVAPGKYADRYLTFVNAVAREVAKKHPDKIIMTMAYGYPTEDPPMKVKPEPNVGVLYCLWNSDWPCDSHGFCQLNKKGQHNLDAWLQLMPGRVLICDYPWNFYRDAERLRYFSAHGVCGIYGLGFRGEFTRLTSYLYARMMWDANLDTNALIDDFMRAYYGEKVAPHMRRYFNLLHELHSRNIEHRQPAVYFVTTFPTEPTLSSPEFADNAYSCFKDAMAAAQGDMKIISRINDERYPVLMLDLTWRNKARGLSDEKLKAYALRLADFLRLARERYAPTVFYSTPLSAWLSQTAGLSLAAGGEAWKKDPKLDEFLADPAGVIMRENRCQEKIEDGWRLPTIGFMGGNEPVEHKIKGAKRMAMRIHRTGSPQSQLWTALFLDEAPAGQAQLELEAQDHDNAGQAQIEIRINDKQIFKGENTFVKKEWSRQTFPIPAGVLKQGKNRIEVVNLTPDGAYAPTADANPNMALEAAKRKSYNWGWFMVSEMNVYVLKSTP